MGGRIGRPVVAAHGEAQREGAPRLGLVARQGALAQDGHGRPRRLRAASVVNPQRVPFTTGNGLESHHYPLLLAGVDGEDARPQQARSHPLHQRRIPLAPDDLLVDPARFAGVHRLPRHQFAVDRQLQVLERGPRRQREEIVGLNQATALVEERLAHLIAEHAVDHLHAHVAPGTDARGGRCARPHGDFDEPAVAARRRRGRRARPGNDAPLGRGGGGRTG